jgi:lipoprotein signal peptidase
MAKRLFSRFLVVLVLLLLVGCDHASKGFAKAELEAGGARELIRGILSLRYVENTDIGFNLLRWVPEATRFPLLLVTGAVAVVALAASLLRVGKKASLLLFALLPTSTGSFGATSSTSFT